MLIGKKGEFFFWVIFDRKREDSLTLNASKILPIVDANAYRGS
jgi:hypothetical protein